MAARLTVIIPNAPPVSSAGTQKKSGTDRTKGLDAATVEALIVAAIASTGAQSKKEMGKVIGALKQHPDAALIDFGAVSKLVQAKLP